MELAPRKQLPPLLLKLNEVVPERLDYLGVSFGATSELFKFWRRQDYVTVYLRQTQVRASRSARPNKLGFCFHHRRCARVLPVPLERHYR